MGFFDLLNHVLNFLAPAGWMAVVMSLASRIFKQNRPMKPSLCATAAINFIVSVVALLLGLIVFGRDGKMASYSAMVVLCATSQWWMLRGGPFVQEKK